MSSSAAKEPDSRFKGPKVRIPFAIKRADTCQLHHLLKKKKKTKISLTVATLEFVFFIFYIIILQIFQRQSIISLLFSNGVDYLGCALVDAMSHVFHDSFIGCFSAKITRAHVTIDRASIRRWGKKKIRLFVPCIREIYKKKKFFLHVHRCYSYANFFDGVLRPFFRSRIPLLHQYVKKSGGGITKFAFFPFEGFYRFFGRNNKKSCSVDFSRYYKFT